MAKRSDYWTWAGRVLASVLLVIAALLVVVGVHGFWFTVLWPNPAKVASYHFSSEAMISYGGWHYSNPELYGWTSLLHSTGVGIALVFASAAAIRRSWRLLVAAGIVIVLVIVGNVVASRVDWERREVLRGTMD